MPLPRTRYARSGELSIAYQVVGSGPLDLVMAPGFVSHLEWGWQEPGVRRFLERLASFTRMLLFDKRGTGLSDPVPGPGTLEERIDDVRAVMDAAESGQAALFGSSEGGAMVMLFAALHPERISSLILYGTAARWTCAADYPYGRPVGPYLDALDSYVDRWGEGVALDVFAPSRADDPAFQEWWAAMQRMGASPGMARQLFSTYAHLDVRDILGAIHVPTLVMHRRGDRVMDPGHGRYLAEHIPGARWVELDGEDHLPFVGDAEQVVAEIEEFLTGSRPPPAAVDRVLATVLFVDVAGSTALAARVGDAAWASMRARFLAAARHELPRYSGTEVDAAGDGIFATFTGPARAIRCAVGIREAAGAIGLSLRTGVHAGEVELEEGGGVSGLAVHIGARVMAEAEPGEVLVTGTVKDLVVGSDLQFTDRGIRTLRGVPGSWPVFAVDA